MSEKLLKLHESTVEKLHAARVKIQRLLDLPELPSENFATSALIHLGLNVLNKMEKTAFEKVFNFSEEQFLIWLSVYYQKWQREHHANGDENSDQRLSGQYFNGINDAGQ